MIRNIDEGPQAGLTVLGSQPFLEESEVLVQKGARGGTRSPSCWRREDAAAEARREATGGTRGY